MGHLLVGLLSHPVDCNFNVPWWVLLKKSDMLLCHQGGICEDRNQKPLFLHVQIEREEIFPQKGFPSGDEAPQRTQGHGFINEFLYLL
jgi:hypothetical protein